MTYPAHLDSAERQIIDWIVKDALKMGCLIRVWDEEALALDWSGDHEAITADVAATGMTTLVIAKPLEGGKRRRIGSVQLVHGNGYDVISDHTDTPEMVELLTNATLTANRLEGGAA